MTILDQIDERVAIRVALHGVKAAEQYGKDSGDSRIEHAAHLLFIELLARWVELCEDAR